MFHHLFFGGALPVLGLLNNLKLFYILIRLFPFYVAREYFLLCYDLCFIVFALLGHVSRPFGDLEIFLPTYEFCCFNLVDNLPSF